MFDRGKQGGSPKQMASYMHLQQKMHRLKEAMHLLTMNLLR